MTQKQYRYFMLWVPLLFILLYIYFQNNHKVLSNHFSPSYSLYAERVVEKTIIQREVGLHLNTRNFQAVTNQTSKNEEENLDVSLSSTGNTNIVTGQTTSSGSAGTTGGNASYNSANGRSRSKTTLLTTITGGKVQVNATGNTDIVGALVSGGSVDSAGNFIDNGQLSLNTGSLTHQDLSNTSYSSTAKYQNENKNKMIFLMKSILKMC